MNLKILVTFDINLIDVKLCNFSNFEDFLAHKSRILYTDTDVMDVFGPSPDFGLVRGSHGKTLDKIFDSLSYYEQNVRFPAFDGISDAFTWPRSGVGLFGKSILKGKFCLIDSNHKG